MRLLGHIAQLWRYPVKSMGGERCTSLVVGPYGIEGDRRFAFESADAPVGKPLLRSADRAAMLRSRASHTAAGVVTVRTPAGGILPVHDPALAAQLGLEPDSSAELRLLEDTLPFTDVRPIALHSLATKCALAEALGGFDGRRLRSNIILDLASEQPFAEDDLSGAVLRLGNVVALTLLERIPRCRMVSLDPETAAADPAILRWLARKQEGRAGIYARTLIPGTLSVGDEVRRAE